MNRRLGFAAMIAGVLMICLVVITRVPNSWWILLGPVCLAAYWHKKLRWQEVVLAILIAFTLCGSWLSPHEPSTQFHDSGIHPLVIDHLDRDILARLIHGNANTISIALAGSLMAGVIGILAGGMLALGRGMWLRLANIGLQAYMSIPLLVHFLMALAFFEPGSKTLIVLFGLTLWPELARMLQAEIANLRRAHFVMVARMQGLEGIPLYMREIVPNLRAVLLVNFVVTMANAIILESILSYLGLGLQLGTPSLGHLIETGTHAMNDHPQILMGAMFFLIGWLVSLRYLMRRLGLPDRRLLFR